MIIGITGKARSGKDTFAEMLAEEFYQLNRQRFILMAYATELKKKVQQDFNLSYEQLWGDAKELLDKRYPRVETVYEDHLVIGDFPTPSQGGTLIKHIDTFWTAREILQAYGQFYRTIDGNFWVKHLFQAITEKEYGNVIVTDVRHPNEADPIKKLDGVIIKVVSERSDKPGIHGVNHISEIAMDDYPADWTIVNNYSLKELRDTAKETVLLITEQRRQQNG